MPVNGVQKSLSNPSLSNHLSNNEIEKTPATSMMHDDSNRESELEINNASTSSENLFIQQSQLSIQQADQTVDENQNLVQFNIRDSYQTVRTSSNNNRCGYYALAIGILGLEEARQLEIFNRIGIQPNVLQIINAPYSEQSLDIIQEIIGDAIYEYALANRHDIVQLINQSSGNNIPVELLEQALSGDTFIQADYLIGIGASLGVAVVLHGHNFTNGDVYIRNNNGIHYEGQLPHNMLESLRIRGEEVNELNFTNEVKRQELASLKTFVQLYKNMLHHKINSNPLVVLLGPTQTGKTSLLNYFIGAQGENYQYFTNRIGKGIESKSSMVVKVGRGGIILADTPGISDNRSSISLKSLIDYQIIELLRSNPLFNLVITFKHGDFDDDRLENNGVRNFIDFFEQHFDIRKMGNDFFNDELQRIKNEDTFLERIRHYREKGTNIFNSDSETFFESMYSTFLDRLAQRIENFDSIPFTTIVKDSKKSNLSKESIIDDINTQIDLLKEFILDKMNEKFSKSSDDNPDFSEDVSESRLLNYYMFLNIIKRNVLIGDISDGSTQKLQSVEAAAFQNRIRFNYDSIKKDLNESDDRQQIFSFITRSVNNILDNNNGLITRIQSYLNSIETNKSQLKAIRNKKLQISRLSRQLLSPSNKITTDQQINYLQDREQELLNKRQHIEDIIENVQNRLNEIDNDTLIQKNGWPKTRQTEGFWFPRVDFFHDSGDQLSLNCSNIYRNDRNTTGYLGFLNWSRSTITADNLVPQNELHQSAIQGYRRELDTHLEKLLEINNELHLISNEIETLDNSKIESNHVQQMLDESVEELQQLEDVFNNDFRGFSNEVLQFESIKLNILTFYHFLNDPSLNYLQSIIQNNESIQRFFILCESLFTDEELVVRNSQSESEF